MFIVFFGGRRCCGNPGYLTEMNVQMHSVTRSFDDDDLNSGFKANLELLTLI